MRLLVFIFSIFCTTATFANPVYLLFDAARLSTYDYLLKDDLSKSSEAYKMYYYSEKGGNKWILRTGIRQEKVIKKIDLAPTLVDNFDFKSIDLSKLSGETPELFLVFQVGDGYTVTKIIELNFFSSENEVFNLLSPKVDFTYHKNIEPNINLSTDDSDSEVYFSNSSKGKYFDQLTFRLIDKNNMTRPKSVTISGPIGILRQSLNGNSEIVLSKIDGIPLEAYEKQLALQDTKSATISSAAKQVRTSTSALEDEDAIRVAANTSERPEQGSTIVLTEKNGMNNQVGNAKATESSSVALSKVELEKNAIELESKKSQKVHVVQLGESLFAIAKKYGTTVKQVSEWNHLNAEAPLKSGMTLLVSENQILPGQTADLRNDKLTEKGGEATKNEQQWKMKNNSPHIVKEGETLVDIAEAYGYTLTRFKSFNQLADDKIVVGQKLLVTDCICGSQAEKVASRPTQSAGKNNQDFSQGESEVRVLSKPAGVQLTSKGPTSKQTYYVVKEDDTLPIIAKKNKVSVEQLQKWNNLEKKDVLVPFQKIIIKNN